MTSYTIKLKSNVWIKRKNQMCGELAIFIGPYTVATLNYSRVETEKAIKCIWGEGVPRDHSVLPSVCVSIFERVLSGRRQFAY